MRNTLHIALMEHLKKHECDREKLTSLYTEFKDAEESTAEALSLYADLVFTYGVDEDGYNSKVTAHAVIGIGLTLRSLANDLSLAQYGRDFSGQALDLLTQEESEDKGANNG